MKARAAAAEQAIDERRARPKNFIASSLLLCLLLVAGASCGGIPIEEPESLRTEELRCDPASSNGSITIHCFGLSFRLPPSFEKAEDPELVFLARSVSSHAVLSIDRDLPNVTEHKPEGQESIESADIDGVDAVIVTNAFLEGLAPELEARELLIANGDRSFSVIMSAREEDLPSLWEEFMGSVRIATNE